MNDPVLMNDGQFFLRFVRDNLPILIFLFCAAVLVGAWVVFESARNLLGRDEVEKLRRRVDELEREQSQFFHPEPTRHVTTDPMVLATRWVSKGGAATTSDGGCLLLVDEVQASESKAMLTIRIDGLPVKRREPLSAGEILELRGKLGAYTVQVGAVSTTQAMLSAWLRSKHRLSV